MTLTDGIRLWFILLYTFGIALFVVTAISFRSRRDTVEKKEYEEYSRQTRRFVPGIW